MEKLLKNLSRTVRNFNRRDDGSSTIEFVIIFPIFATIMMGGFEIGYYTVSSSMLDRGLDLAVRDVRLGKMENVTLSALKESVCDYAVFVGNCDENIHIALEPVTAEAFTSPSLYAECLDRDAEVEPATTFSDGDENELMLVRACVLVDPFFPTTWLGATLQTSEGSGYAISSISGFVNEPNT
jgi:Flp pilus assembly protein TadG